MLSNGLIMHLVSNKKGTVSKVHHEDEIKGMDSVRLLSVESKVGEPIVETVNIRTDSGYVLLENVDPEVLQRDYERIIELQETMFEVEEDVMPVEGKVEGEGKGEMEMEVEKEMEVEMEVERGVVTDVEDVEDVEESVVVTKSRRRRRIQATEEENNSALEQSQDEEHLQSETQRQQQLPFDQEPLRAQGESVGRAVDIHSSIESPQVKEIIKKMSRLGLRVSAILTGYCVAVYASALLIPLIYSA